MIPIFRISYYYIFIAIDSKYRIASWMIISYNF